MAKRRRRHGPEQIIRKLQQADVMLSVGKTIGQVVQVLEGSLEVLDGLHADLVALVGVRKYPMRMKCVLLAWNAARAALTSAD